MSNQKFTFDIAVSDAQRETISAGIEQTVARITDAHGDVCAEERQRVGNLLRYNETPVDDICYDHYKARLHRLMFPDDDDMVKGIRGFIRRYYRKVIRRLLRQQLVFNQSVVGTLDDMNERLRILEQKIIALQNKKDK